MPRPSCLDGLQWNGWGISQSAVRKSQFHLNATEYVRQSNLKSMQKFDVSHATEHVLRPLLYIYMHEQLEHYLIKKYNQ